MKRQISVIGCGWLGLPLAKFLVNSNFKIKGSTTSKYKLELLKQYNIDGFKIKLNETEISGNYNAFLKTSETIVINIPPGLRKNPNKNHVTELKHLIKAIETSKIKNVLYVSSTSVFKDDTDFPIITDKTKPNTTSNSGKQIIEIEKMLESNSNFNTTILRFGGLFDTDRHPAKHLSGRKNILNPNAPINLIHKEDCINIITYILKTNLWNVTLNAAYPLHTDKKTYYSAYCKNNNRALPEFNNSEESKGKIVDSSKLVQLLNYSFKQAP